MNSIVKTVVFFLSCWLAYAPLVAFPVQAQVVSGGWVHTFGSYGCTGPTSSSIKLGPGAWVNAAEVAYNDGAGSVGFNGTQDASVINECLNVEWRSHWLSDLCIAGAWALSGLTGGVIAGAGAVVIAGSAPLTMGQSIWASGLVAAAGGVAGGWVYNSIAANHSCELRLVPA